MEGNDNSKGTLVLARLSKLFRDPRDDPAGWAIRTLMAMCLVCGFWLRVRGFLYDVPAMWLDECSWAMMTVELPLRELSIRPPGFMAVSKLLAFVFGPTETALRALPWLSAVATLFMAPFLARRLFSSSAARLLFVSILALHPAATDLAKEFKPYTLSLALHVGLVLLTLRYLSSRTKRDLAALVGVAGVGILFAQDLVFALPGVFSLIGWNAFKNDRRHLPAILASAAVIIAVLLVQYALIWRNLPTGEADYWGDKYHVFYVPSRGNAYVSWLTGRYQNLVVLPGHQNKFWNGRLMSNRAWHELGAIAEGVWMILHFLGLSMLAWRRRFREIWLLVLPLPVLVVFNRFGYWPFGVFRSNLFLLTYVGAIAAAALDGKARETESSAWGLIPASVLLWLPFFFFEEGWPATKRAFCATSQYPELLERLAHEPRKPKREVLLLTHGACEPWQFFLEYHPATQKLRKQIQRRFDARCVEDPTKVLAAMKRATKSPPHRVWTLGYQETVSDYRQYFKRIRTDRFDRHALTEYKPKGSKRR